MTDRSNPSTSRRDLLVATARGLAAAALVPGLAFLPEAARAAPRTKARGPEFTERFVPHARCRIYVRDYAGTGPAFVMMHGFPDNLRIYDALVPLLVAAGRRVVTFDFLGFGRSDKPEDFPYSFEQQLGDLQAVADGLGLDRIVPVAHDASGPAAIDFALANRRRVPTLVLLNTVYANSPALRLPEFITMFTDERLRGLLDQMVADPKQFGWILRAQQNLFLANASDETKRRLGTILQPAIDEQFGGSPSARPAFVRMTAGLPDILEAGDRRLAELRDLPTPVRLIWGAEDPYLNAGLAKDLASRFPSASLDLLPAGHWPQIDAPERVAALMLKGS